MTVPRQELEIYRAALKEAWADGILTADEENMLRALRKSMGIPLEDHEVILSAIKKERTKLSVDAYKLALELALMDNIITSEEKQTLEKLREVLGLSEDEHNQLETEIKAKKGRIVTFSEKEALKEHKTSDTKIVWLSEPQESAEKSTKTPEELPDETEDVLGLIRKGEELWSSSDGSKEKALEAIKYFDRALKLDPFNYLGWADKGVILKKLQEDADALKCYETAIQLKPDFLNAWYNKAALLGSMGKFEEAVECFEKVLELDPDNMLAARDKKLIENMIAQKKHAKRGSTSKR